MEDNKVVTSEQYEHFAKLWGFEHVMSSPHFPQSNGFIEKTIQTVKNALRKCRTGNFDPELALLCIHATPIRDSIPSPAELLYTRKKDQNKPCNENAKHTAQQRSNPRELTRKTTKPEGIP